MDNRQPSLLQYCYCSQNQILTHSIQANGRSRAPAFFIFIDEHSISIMLSRACSLRSSIVVGARPNDTTIGGPPGSASSPGVGSIASIHLQGTSIPAPVRVLTIHYYAYMGGLLPLHVFCNKASLLDVTALLGCHS